MYINKVITNKNQHELNMYVYKGIDSDSLCTYNVCYFSQKRMQS